MVDLVGQARREDLSLPLSDDPRAGAAALRLQNAPGDANDLAKLAVDSGAKRADDLLVTARVRVEFIAAGRAQRILKARGLLWK
ncbi:hypothetical protein ACVWXO_004343 [Bradyrhizobium sp. LM2.7]